jgi:hypothetical protein|tara:strand:+ start:541 stop:762 length:222 start_codon:yes stop_codon:yes gene_type:complete
MIESIHYGIKLNLKSVEDAREYLRQFKDMSLVIRLNNESDYNLLTKGIFKMRGMKRIKIINGLENPRTYHFER